MSTYDTNHVGMPVDRLVISMQVAGPFIRAEYFIKALREVQAKAHLVASGIVELSAADIFVLKMAAHFRNNDFSGTATLLPDDIMEILHPGWVKFREDALKEAAV